MTKVSVQWISIYFIVCSFSSKTFSYDVVNRLATSRLHERRRGKIICYIVLRQKRVWFWKLVLITFESGFKLRISIGERQYCGALNQVSLIRIIIIITEKCVLNLNHLTFFKGSKGKLTTGEWKNWSKFEFSPHIRTIKKRVLNRSLSYGVAA